MEEGGGPCAAGAGGKWVTLLGGLTWEDKADCER